MPVLSWKIEDVAGEVWGKPKRSSRQNVQSVHWFLVATHGFKVTPRRNGLKEEQPVWKSILENIVGLTWKN